MGTSGYAFRLCLVRDLKLGLGKAEVGVGVAFEHRIWKLGGVGMECRHIHGQAIKRLILILSFLGIFSIMYPTFSVFLSLYAIPSTIPVFSVQMQTYLAIHKEKGATSSQPLQRKEKPDQRGGNGR